MKVGSEPRNLGKGGKWDLHGIPRRESPSAAEGATQPGGFGSPASSLASTAGWLLSPELKLSLPNSPLCMQFTKHPECPDRYTFSCLSCMCLLNLLGRRVYIVAVPRADFRLPTSRQHLRATAKYVPPASIVRLVPIGQG